MPRPQAKYIPVQSSHSINKYIECPVDAAKQYVSPQIMSERYKDITSLFPHNYVLIY